MTELQSYLSGSWNAGSGQSVALYNPSTEEVIAQTCTEGLDLAEALEYARQVGGENLRALSFAERGALLTKMANTLHEHRERLLIVSRECNGATRSDSKFDVDGATATLSAYGRYGEKMGDEYFQLDGTPSRISSNARHIGQHVRLPRPGVAVHINAFNFPAWGAFEKMAVAFLAGMPVLTKPAQETALLTYEMIKILVEADFLPEGSLSFLAGPPQNLIDCVKEQDVVAFTGSASTAGILRSKDSVVSSAARFNAEADSLNAAILGADVGVGSDIWHRFINNLVNDITQKAGQKCTAVRRILVPDSLVEAVSEALLERLEGTRIGYPVERAVQMGALASKKQLDSVRAGIQAFSAQSKVLCGGAEPVQGLHAPEGKGYFVAPTLFLANDSDAEIFHSQEIFGPCSTILSYDGSAERALTLMKKGCGSLVTSVYSNDRKWLQSILLSAASWNGRLFVVSAKVADSALTPGTVLANQMHGGPGRAGGGFELGGLRALDLYTNCTAIQGDRALLGKLIGHSL
jgi:phenylacetic acid degradation protein PaaN